MFRMDIVTGPRSDYEWYGYIDVDNPSETFRVTAEGETRKEVSDELLNVAILMKIAAIEANSIHEGTEVNVVGVEKRPFELADVEDIKESHDKSDTF